MENKEVKVEDVIKRVNRLIEKQTSICDIVKNFSSDDPTHKESVRIEECKLENFKKIRDFLLDNYVNFKELEFFID